MLLFPILHMNMLSVGPITYTCTCIYEHTLTCNAALLVLLSCSEFSDCVRARPRSIPVRQNQRETCSLSIRQGSRDYRLINLLVSCSVRMCSIVFAYTYSFQWSIPLVMS